ncbi:MAG: tRNA pseudouridine(38-40) synthase TruA [Ktedonobacterales bacterium]
MNLAALVEYDGTRFAGFQRQSAEKGPTVQGAIEAALERIAGEAIGIEAAGRTDSGVHATGQVVSFHPPSRLDPRDGGGLDAGAWQRALNATLPDDIAARAVRSVSEDFRARWSASSRSYCYRILCAPVRAPLRERYVWRVSQRLDVAAMDEAAALLLGEHDFGAFGSSPRDQRETGYRGHTVRTMFEARCRWRPVPPGEGEPDEVECLFTANAFLTGMVRRLVGTLVLVGMGRLSVAEFRGILEARDERHPGAAAPAHGLCLTRVEYPTGMVEW